MFLSAIVYIIHSYISAYLLCTEFQMPVSNGSLAIAMKPKAEVKLRY